MNRFSFLSRRLVPLVALLLSFSLWPACTAVPVGDDAIGEFRLGELQTVVQANFQQTYDATRAALEEQGLFITGDRRQVVEAVINARDRGDTAVTVKIKEMAVNQTSVRIRYGRTGDAARSQLLYREIAARL
jgi:hypothetical protein